MFSHNVKRLLSVLLLAFTLSVSGAGLLPTQTEAAASGAGSASGIIVSCRSLGSWITNKISSYLGVASEVPVGEAQLRAKECTDGIAWALAKTLLAQITNSVLTWINTGFQGNPFFIGNGDSFFRNLANDQIQLTLGQIQGTGNYYFDSIRAGVINGVRSGLLGDLTSTFDTDVQRSLCSGQNSAQANYYLRVTRGTQMAVEGPFTTYSQCQSRRTTALQSSDTQVGDCQQAQNSICMTGLGQGNASTRLAQGRTLVNAFTSGQIPFRWDLFNSLTQNCGNNPYCSQVAAQRAIQSQVGNVISNTTQQLLQGGGFLGQRECADKYYEQDVAEWESQLSEESSNDLSVPTDIGPRPQCSSWTTKTPGKIIADKLTGSLGSTDRQLELADELNESIAAVFTALINKLIEKGLSSFDGKGNDSYDSLINDPRSGFQFDQGTTLDQLSNPQDCEDLGGTFNTDTNSCDFVDTETGGLPTFPWTIDGQTYETIETIIQAFPGRCVNIDGLQVLPGTEPCLEGTSSSDTGGGLTDYTGIMTVSPSTITLGSQVTISIVNAQPNTAIEVSDGESLISIGVTDQNGSYSTTYTPNGAARTLTIHGDAEATTIAPVDLIVTGGQ